MSKFGFCGPGYQSQSPNVAALRTVNYLTEPVEIPGGKTAVALYGTPGTKRFSPLTGDSSVNAEYEINGRMFAFGDTNLVEIFNGAATAISAASNAAAAEFTSAAHPLANNYGVEIAGGTGAWAAVNGLWPVTKTGASTFTIAVNSTGFGALTGALTFALRAIARGVIGPYTGGVTVAASPSQLIFACGGRVFSFDLAGNNLDLPGGLNVVVKLQRQGTGAYHDIVVNGRTYHYVELITDTPDTIAVALAALINAAGGDVDVLATAASSGGILTLYRKANRAAISVVTSDQTGTQNSVVWTLAPMGVGRLHIIGVNDRNYGYFEQAGDTAATIATAMRGQINAGSGDADVVALAILPGKLELIRRASGTAIVLTPGSGSMNVAPIRGTNAYQMPDSSAGDDPAGVLYTVAASGNPAQLHGLSINTRLYAIFDGGTAADMATKLISYINTGINPNTLVATYPSGDPLMLATATVAGQFRLTRLVNGVQIALGPAIPSEISLSTPVAGTNFYMVPDPDEATAPTMPGPFSQVAFVDGFGLALVQTSQQFYISSLFEVKAWDALDVAQISYCPDNVLAMFVDHREVWFLGRTRTVVYGNTGNPDFPFEPSPGGLIEAGIVAAGSPARADNSIFWLGGDERGAALVWRADGYRPSRVSNFALEYAMQHYATVADAVGSSFQMNGHTYYRLWFPTAGATWLLDVASGQWTEWLYWDGTAYVAHKGACHVYAFGKHLWGARDAGLVLEASDSYQDDDGQAICRTRRAPHLCAEQEWQFGNSLQIDLEAGLALAPTYAWAKGTAYGLGAIRKPTAATGRAYICTVAGTSHATTEPIWPAAHDATIADNGVTWKTIAYPEMSLHWSQDSGKSWSNEYKALAGGSLGALTRLIWRRLGRYRDRVYEAWTLSPSPWRIVDAYLK